MKVRWLLVISWVVLSTCAWIQAAQEIVISTDRPEAVYAVGDTAVFEVEVTDGKKPLNQVELRGELSTDGFRHAESVPVKMIEGEPAEQAKELVRLLREEAKII